MGEYLSIFRDVQNRIYENKISEACLLLKSLLNKINIEYTTMTDAKEKDKRKKAIKKLLPALQDLKKNKITSNVVTSLMLDFTKISGLFEHEAEKINPSKTSNDSTEDNKPADVITPNRVDNSKPEKEYGYHPDPEKKTKKVLVPLTFDDYIGQTKVKEGLKVSIEAAKKDKRVLNHMLICSPYGLGKTTLANIIANEMDMPFFAVNATNLKDTKSLCLYFSKIKESCIIFIDEIHSLKNDVQTNLLSILTDYYVSFINEAGEQQTFDLPPFTLIGATTQAGELLKPFLNRFTILELVDYTEQEKEIIVYTKFQKLGYEINPDAVKEVSNRSRGIPRTIETYAKGIRDIALTENTKVVTKEITDRYFELYEIDCNGLGKNDLLILNILADAKRPLALITLESKTGIQREDLEYRYEPYLIKLGLLDKTDKGRVITEKGIKYLEDPTSANGGNSVEKEENEMDEVEVEISEDDAIQNSEIKKDESIKTSELTDDLFGDIINDDNQSIEEIKSDEVLNDDSDDHNK